MLRRVRLGELWINIEQAMGNEVTGSENDFLAELTDWALGQESFEKVQYDVTDTVRTSDYVEVNKLWISEADTILTVQPVLAYAPIGSISVVEILFMEISDVCVVADGLKVTATDKDGVDEYVLLCDGKMDDVHKVVGEYQLWLSRMRNIASLARLWEKTSGPDSEASAGFYENWTTVVEGDISTLPKEMSVIQIQILHEGEDYLALYQGEQACHLLDHPIRNFWRLIHRDKWQTVLSANRVKEAIYEKLTLLSS